MGNGKSKKKRKFDDYSRGQKVEGEVTNFDKMVGLQSHSHVNEKFADRKLDLDLSRYIPFAKNNNYKVFFTIDSPYKSPSPHASESSEEEIYAIKSSNQSITSLKGNSGAQNTKSTPKKEKLRNGEFQTREVGFSLKSSEELLYFLDKIETREHIGESGQEADNSREGHRSRNSLRSLEDLNDEKSQKGAEEKPLNSPISSENNELLQLEIFLDSNGFLQLEVSEKSEKFLIKGVNLKKIDNTKRKSLEKQKSHEIIRKCREIDGEGKIYACERLKSSTANPQCAVKRISCAELKNRATKNFSCENESAEEIGHENKSRNVSCKFQGQREKCREKFRKQKMKGEEKDIVQLEDLINKKKCKCKVYKHPKKSVEKSTSTPPQTSSKVKDCGCFRPSNIHHQIYQFETYADSKKVLWDRSVESPENTEARTSKTSQTIGCIDGWISANSTNSLDTDASETGNSKSVSEKYCSCTNLHEYSNELRDTNSSLLTKASVMSSKHSVERIPGPSAKIIHLMELKYNKKLNTLEELLFNKPSEMITFLKRGELHHETVESVKSYHEVLNSISSGI